jgi:hypothetical protein
MAITESTQTRQATDPKDKSYAVYGILQRLGILIESPDYSKRTSQIYQEFFLILLKSGMALDLLLNAGSLSDSPSWVPDLSVQVGRGWMKRSKEYFNLLTLPTWVPFNLTDSLLAFSYIGLMRGESPKELWESSRVLRGNKSSVMPWSLGHDMAWSLQYPCFIVSGFWIGKIVISSQPFLDETDANDEMKTNIWNLLKWLSLVNKEFLKYSAFTRAFNSERIAELGLLGGSRPRFFTRYRAFTASWSLLWRFTARGSLSEEDVVFILETMKHHASDSTQNLFRTLASEKRILFASRWGTVQDSSENNDKKIGNFNFGMPHTGMFVGSCSDNAQVGDRIAIIPGLSLPLISRNRGSGYQVVGPAHIPVLLRYFRTYFKGKSDPKWEAIILN